MDEKIYKNLEEYAGLNREEADDYFAVEDEGNGWRVKARRYLEVETFRAVLTLTREYGGNYYQEDKLARFFIPKSVKSEDVTPEAVKMDQSKPLETEEDYSLAKSLNGKYGQIVPCLADAEGRVFDGIHRKKIKPDAWTVKLDHIKNNVDRTFARMIANKVRRQYRSDELSDDIGFLLGAGYTVPQIAEITGISERTIIKYKPAELKDQIKVEAGKKGAEIKQELYKRKPEGFQQTVKTQETVQLETPQFTSIQEGILAELKTCEGCGAQIHRSQLQIRGGKLLCPKCRGEKPSIKPEPQAKEVKPKESWEHRKAVMTPQKSQMEQSVLTRLHGLGLHVDCDTKFCLQSTTPDFYFPNRNLAVYLDGVVHRGREDRDEALRDLLKRRHGVNVVSIPYKSFTQEEVERVVKTILERVENE